MGLVMKYAKQLATKRAQRMLLKRVATPKIGGVLVGLGALYLLQQWWSRSRKDKDIENTNHSEEKNPTWDKVDETGWESFPASDPPSTY